MTPTEEKPNTTYQCPHCDCFIVIPNNDYYDHYEQEWVPGGYFDGMCSCGRSVFEAPRHEPEILYFDAYTETNYMLDHLGKSFTVQHRHYGDFADWRAFELPNSDIPNPQELESGKPLFRTVVRKAIEQGEPAKHEENKAPSPPLRHFTTARKAGRTRRLRKAHQMSTTHKKTPVEAATSNEGEKNLQNDSLDQPITLRQALVNEIFEHMLDKVIFGYREDIVTVDNMTFEDMEIICAHFELSLNQILECVKGDFQ